jgi:hypothetical protein
MVLVCAECQCAPPECAQDNQNITQCKNCIKPVCCCIDFHRELSNNTSHDSNNHIPRFSLIITF